jgi:hypothetical protein
LFRIAPSLDFSKPSFRGVSYRLISVKKGILRGLLKVPGKGDFPRAVSWMHKYYSEGSLEHYAVPEKEGCTIKTYGHVC